MNFENIKQLITLFDQSTIKEMKIEKGDLILSLAKPEECHLVSKQAPEIEKVIQTIAEEPIMEEELLIVAAPLVGAFYASPSPDDAPFVKIGDQVAPDTVLCIIEAMKIMNEIEADVHGEIVEILVKNEEIVEVGQPVMKIRRKNNV